mmetsp:Transcript_37493/g.74391  ORF Transcript_37493/g.74391 Transcript_37493/m.74391 type:complete len:257 (+) Transcript_37493:744-1514(+)
MRHRSFQRNLRLHSTICDFPLLPNLLVASQRCQLPKAPLDLVTSADLTEIEAKLCVVALFCLRLVDEAQRHVMPFGLESCTSILNQADAEESVHCLRRSGKHADIREHSTEQDPFHTSCAELFLQRCRCEGTERPFINHDLPRPSSQVRMEFIAFITRANKIIPHVCAVTVRAAVGNRQAHPTCRCKEPTATLHACTARRLRVVLANSACWFQKVCLHVNEHQSCVVAGDGESALTLAAHGAFRGQFHGGRPLRPC